jgi:signal peptidase I
VLYAIAGLVVVPLLCATVLVARRFAVVEVAGPSMEPTLHDGDRVLARRVHRGRLARGDVVVIRHPAADTWLVKRIAALPGDAVPDSIRRSRMWPDGTFVPPAAVVVLGDNEQSSFDSRDWGWFGLADVLAVVVRPLSHSDSRSPRRRGSTQAGIG